MNSIQKIRVNALDMLGQLLVQVEFATDDLVIEQKLQNISSMARIFYEAVHRESSKVQAEVKS